MVGKNAETNRAQALGWKISIERWLASNRVLAGGLPQASRAHVAYAYGERAFLGIKFSYR